MGVASVAALLAVTVLEPPSVALSSAAATASPPFASRVVRAFDYESDDPWEIFCERDACRGGTVFTVAVDMPAGTPLDVTLTATLDHEISSGDQLLVLGAHSRGRTDLVTRMRPGYFRITGRGVDTTTMQWVLRSFVPETDQEYFHVIVHGRDRGGADGYTISGHRGSLEIELTSAT